jgi:hypothetical protein
MFVHLLKWHDRNLFFKEDWHSSVLLWPNNCFASSADADDSAPAISSSTNSTAAFFNHHELYEFSYGWQLGIIAP